MVLYAPNYSLRDIYDFTHAAAYVGEAIYPQQLPYDARELGLKFDLPFFIFEGEADSITPPDLAKAYFDSVQAPVKGWATFKGVGHSAVLLKPDEFLALPELLRRAPWPAGGSAYFFALTLMLLVECLKAGRAIFCGEL